MVDGGAQLSPWELVTGLVTTRQLPALPLLQIQAPAFLLVNPSPECGATQGYYNKVFSVSVSNVAKTKRFAGCRLEMSPPAACVYSPWTVLVSPPVACSV